MYTIIVKESESKFQSYEIEYTGGYFGKGEIVFDSRKDTLTKKYEKILEDISAKRNIARHQQEKSESAKRFLDNTDWYIIRQMEEGIPCPPDIKVKRANSRKEIVT